MFIHDRLSVCLSLNTNDTRICSNMCFTLKTPIALPIKESSISLSTSLNDTYYNQMNLKTTSPPPSSTHDDIMCNRKKFSIDLDVFKLADSDTENVGDLDANACGNDGLKSKTSRRFTSRRASGSSATC